jgi:hypothetical protein
VFHTDAARNDYAINLQILSLAAMFVVTGPRCRSQTSGDRSMPSAATPKPPDAWASVSSGSILLSLASWALRPGVASIVQAQLAET